MELKAAAPLVLLLACGAGPSQADASVWETASDIGAYGLIAVALAAPLASGDRTGAWQAVTSIAVAEVVTVGLKQLISEERPDQSGDDSFPSAHTSRAFSAAATMHRRYGWRAGIPATAVAALVGVARVHADRHHWHDVAAGAVIGELCGMLLTDPFDERVQLVPWVGRRSGVIAVAIKF